MAYPHFSELFLEEVPANTTGSVDGLRTEPVIRKKTQAKFVRRNAIAGLKKSDGEHEFR
jgi:hypothetical protein